MPPVEGSAAAARVGVVVPARDAEATLARTLESLLAQTMPAWEAVVVDDGSTDGTAAIAAAFAARDARVRLVRQEPKGLCPARNRGIAELETEWLHFLDADDWLVPTAFQRLVAASEFEGADAAYGGFERVDDAGRVIATETYDSSGDLFSEFAGAPFIPVHTCIVRRELVVDVGCFDEGEALFGDWDLWLRIARTGANFRAVDGVVCAYRTRAGSMSMHGPTMIEDGFRLLELAHGRDPRLAGPDVPHGEGRRREELPLAKTSLALWVCGCWLGQGEDAAALAGRMEGQTDLRLAPEQVASAVFAGVPLGAVRPREDWPALWAEVEAGLDRLLLRLEELSGTPLLARRARRALERWVAYDVAAPRVEVGRTTKLRVELTEPVADVHASGELLICEPFLAGAALAPVELPVSDGVAPAAVVCDAISARHSWGLLRELLTSTVYWSLERRPERGFESVWREGVRLAESAPGSDLHPVVGWTVFLQELWGKPGWTHARFYEPESPDEQAPTVDAVDIFTLEVASEVPDLDVASDEVLVRVTVGGALAAIFSLPGRRLISAQELRRQAMATTGFELCRIAVREAVVGRALTGPTLRERLAEAASARARGGPGRATPAPGERSLLLARRPGRPVGTSVSREAALPAAAWPELQQAAAVAGEGWVGPSSGTPIESVRYAPGIAPEPAPDLPAVSPAVDYEQERDGRTLARLPDGPVASALLLGCGGGRLLADLASRVGALVAADSSAEALERARDACSSSANVSFVELETFGDHPRGPFDLVVCRDVFPDVPLDRLRPAAESLAKAVRPGGRLLMLYENLVVDGPERPAFDSDRPFGGSVITQILGQTSVVRLLEEVRAPLYRLHVYERPRRLSRRRPPSAVETSEFPELPQHVAERIVWTTDGSAPDGRDGAIWSSRLPVLAYRRVTEGVSEGSERGVSPQVFEEQLRLLRARGFRSCGLDEWRAAATAGRPLPGRPVLITFDGGYGDFLAEAWPLLRRYGLKAMVFLVAGEVGGVSSWDPESAAPLLDWPEVRRLAEDGVLFGSLTLSHRPLTGLSPGEVVRELAGSRALIERELARPIAAFAYPLGETDPALGHLVGACGYTYALTGGGGACSPDDWLLALPRIAVTDETSFDVLVDELAEPIGT